VISLATGRKAYLASLSRLRQSLQRVRFPGDFLGWLDEYPPGSPSQLEAPMAFKTFCFQEARRHGYRFVLWIDAPVVALRRLEPIITMIRRNGYVTFTNNYDQMLGQWSSDETLRLHGISREQAMLIPETPTSVIGLDLGHPLGIDFLERWHSICCDGLTCRGRREPYRSSEDHYAVAWNKDHCISQDPRVGGHRHDQTAAGIVAHQLGLRPYAESLRDWHYKKKPVDRTTILLHHREFGETISSLESINYQTFYAPLLARPRRLLSGARRRILRLNESF